MTARAATSYGIDVSRMLWTASLVLGLCALTPTASAQTLDEAAHGRALHEHPRTFGASARRAPNGSRPIFLGLMAALFLVIGGLAGAADKKSS